jgi:hypothetical protein
VVLGVEVAGDEDQRLRLRLEAGVDEQAQLQRLPGALEAREEEALAPGPDALPG